MCPSFWKLHLDNFLFFSSSPAHLELELELFEVDDIGDDIYIMMQCLSVCHEK